MLLSLCVGNSPVTGEFPKQRPVTWNFDVFFYLRLNKLLSKQSCMRLVIWDAIAAIMTSLWCWKYMATSVWIQLVLSNNQKTHKIKTKPCIYFMGYTVCIKYERNKPGYKRKTSHRSICRNVCKIRNSDQINKGKFSENYWNTHEKNKTKTQPYTYLICI